MRGKWVLISISLVLLAVAAGALSHLRRTSAQSTAQAPKVPEKPPQSDEVSLSGRIEAQQVVTVPAGSGGSVAEFQADVGQDVFEGAVLARIGNQALQLADENARLA